MSLHAVRYAELQAIAGQADPRSEREWMLAYMPLVRRTVRGLSSHAGTVMDRADMEQVGLVGLLEALRRYGTPDAGFESYAALRIRGAILDELRNMDWVPRLVRHRTARVEQARQRIEMEFGRKATDEEIASRLCLDEEEFSKYKRDSRATTMTSITRKAYPSDGSREVREIDVISDESQANPVRLLQRKDLKELMTKGLSRAERLIIILYYYESMTMKEIGLTLDLSESRVSQMHSSILARLKAQMQHRMRELEPMR